MCRVRLHLVARQIKMKKNKPFSEGGIISINPGEVLIIPEKLAKDLFKKAKRKGRTIVIDIKSIVPPNVFIAGNINKNDKIIF